MSIGFLIRTKGAIQDFLMAYGKAVLICFLNLQLIANHIRNVFGVSDIPFYLTSVDISKLSTYTLSELGECEIQKESPNFELQKKKIIKNGLI